MSIFSDDALYEQVEQLALEAGKIDTATLQRKFGIGYTRAYALIDKLAENGVTEKPVGVDPEVTTKMYG
jgi:DNA segregation ATPase FtsK/SpoIIIE-like protein